MIKKVFLTLCLFYFALFINVQSAANGQISNLKTVKNHTSGKNNDDNFEIICDSIYKNKGYKLSLSVFDSSSDDENIPNTLFTLSKFRNGKYLPIFSDSIFNSVQSISFVDFNNDKVKDILVQNYSDVRSNWSYHLYLININKDKLKKVKGFETIRNPNYLPQYGLIDNYVLSGTNWTNFYKITGDSIKDFNMIIYDNQNENGVYNREYQRAINKIRRKVKNKR